MPNLIVDGVVEQLRSNPVKKIYFCNAMTQPGETMISRWRTMLRPYRKHSFPEAVDIVITHNNRARTVIFLKNTRIWEVNLYGWCKRGAFLSNSISGCIEFR